MATLEMAGGPLQLPKPPFPPHMPAKAYQWPPFQKIRQTPIWCCIVHNHNNHSTKLHIATNSIAANITLFPIEPTMTSTVPPISPSPSPTPSSHPHCQCIVQATHDSFQPLATHHNPINQNQPEISCPSHMHHLNQAPSNLMPDSLHLSHQPYIENTKKKISNYLHQLLSHCPISPHTDAPLQTSLPCH